MKYKTDNIIIRIEPELKAKAQERAEQQGDNLSRYIIGLIKKDMKEAGMRYIYMREQNGDIKTYESNKLDEVTDYAERDWNHLTDREQSKCGFAHVIESANPDESAENHFDGDFIKVFK